MNGEAAVISNSALNGEGPCLHALVLLQQAGAMETTAFAVGQTLGPLLSLPLVGVFDVSNSAPWLADGLAPSAWPAAAVSLLLIPCLAFVEQPELRPTDSAGADAPSDLTP
jgi:hypothetical protein